MKVVFNSLGQVTNLLLGSPVVGLPYFSLWTGMFCGISSAYDGTVTLLGLGTQSLIVRAGFTTGT
jgi:hypothetical protein